MQLHDMASGRRATQDDTLDNRWTFMLVTRPPDSFPRNNGIRTFKDTPINIMSSPNPNAFLANVAWLWALARGGIVRIAPLQFAQPILAVLFASLLLKEVFTLRLLLATIVIVTGIIVAHRAVTALADQPAEA